MTTHINNGWLYLTNGTDDMKLAVQRIEIERKREPTIDHFEGGGHYGFDLGKQWFEFKCKNIFFDDSTDKNYALKYLDEWAKARTLTLSIYKNSTPTKEEIDGNGNTDCPVLYYGEKYYKASPGEGTVYVIKSIKFEQSGALTS